MREGEASATWVADLILRIGDGIAWRVLNYDRSSLRLLAEHPPISAPQLDIGLVTELGELLRIIYEEGRQAVLGAVTNFLRVGDITTYDSSTDSATVVEVKTENIATARTRSQGEYLSVVQEGLRAGEHSVSGVRIRKIVAAAPLKTYVLSVERAMREAEQKLSASRRFGDILTVAVLATDQMVDTIPESDWDRARRPAMDRLARAQSRKTDRVLPMNNLDTLTHFSPNMAPYAVFPIEPRLRFKLLTGEFHVLSALNVSALARWLGNRGWSNEVFDPSPDLDLTQPLMNIPALRVSIEGVSVEIGLGLLAIAALEFWMPESIEEAVRTIFAISPDSTSADQTPDWLTQVNFPNAGTYAWD